MEITDVRIFKARRKGAVLAYANVILDGKFIIRGITLVETEKNGRFISMPSRRLRNGERSYRDVCHPLNSDIRTELTEKIFAAYDEFIESEE
ncbi:MAG: SpoVG family protein [Clostridia bacterium]|jgi:stage V sporulation protein G|nr:SpoVG family protein [Clostridia bacterium]